MDQDDEQLAIAQFLAEKGATVCPPAFAAAVTGAVPPPEAARRLAELELAPWLTARALQRATAHAQRGRQRAIVAGKAPRR